MGLFRGPQLQTKVVQTLQSALANSGAISGTVHVLGASVVPETPVAHSDFDFVPGGSALLALMQPADASGGGRSGVAPVLIILGLLFIGRAGVAYYCKSQKDGGRWEDEEEAFTGH